MNLDRRYLVWSLAYIVMGMGLGIFMAASHDFGQHPTHAHILLVGFVVSFAYGIIHKLWPTKNRALGNVQFIVHQIGVALMAAGLLLLNGNIMSEERLAPVLTIASLAILSGALLMAFLVLTKKAVNT